MEGLQQLLSAGHPHAMSFLGKTSCVIGGGGSPPQSGNGSYGVPVTAIGLRPCLRSEFFWTSLITEHIKCGQGRKALRIYEEMQQGGVKPSSYTFVAALKACSILEDLESTQHIHAELIESGFEADVYVGTMLVRVYAKCGSLVDARRVFEKMPHRNVVSWTAMISGYAQMGDGENALKLYSQMQQEGLVPNERTIVAALKACSFRGQHLEQVRAIHLDAVKGDLETDVFVGNMLVDAYAKCGSLVDARGVFEKMPRRDVISWTAMILGYAHMEQAEEALHLYAQSEREGVVPDDRIFVAALKACSCLAAADEGSGTDKTVKSRCLEQIRAIHLQVLKSGSDTAVFVGNMLVDAYAKCGSMEEARHVFEKMPCRDVVSWTAMILGYSQMGAGEVALQLYAQMQQEGIVLDDRAFAAALKACSSLGALGEGGEGDVVHVRNRCLKQVRIIHADVVKHGSSSDVFVGNMLVDIYAKCGSLVDARHVFESMPHRNVVSWTVMILAYAHMEEGEIALQLYSRMQEEGVVPNDRTFVGALRACSSLTAVGNESDGMSRENLSLEKIRAIHSDILKSSSGLDVFVGTMLVDVYAKCGSLVDARHVFDTMPQRNVVSWDTMILGYAQMEEGEEALQLYERMQQEGVKPDECTFVGVLKACSVLAGLEKGKEVHAQISSIGADVIGVYVPTMLIDMYGKCGSMVDAQEVFDALPTRDMVAWSALIAGYARQGDCDHVFEMFQRMREDGIQPNGVTFLSVLLVCSHLGLVEQGQKYFETMSRDFGIRPTVQHYTCMVDLLGRAGRVEKAISVVRTMPFEPDTAVWGTVLGACRKWRNVELGKQAFDFAIRLDKTDAAAYGLMSDIYAAAHMWEDAQKIQLMRMQTCEWKQQGQSWWTDISGGVHIFVVDDRGHPKERQIYAELLELLLKLVEEEHVPNLRASKP